MVRRRTLLPLIALLLLLQAVVAPGLCLAHAARAGAGHTVELCSADGMRTIRIDDNGDPIADVAPMAGGFCTACHAIPDATFAAAPAPITPAWVRVAVSLPVRQAANPAPAIRGPPLGAQAPPFLA